MRRLAGSRSEFRSTIVGTKGIIPAADRIAHRPEQRGGIGYRGHVGYDAQIGDMLLIGAEARSARGGKTHCREPHGRLCAEARLDLGRVGPSRCPAPNVLLYNRSGL